MFFNLVTPLSNNTVTQGVELQTTPQVTARCGEDVTLTCEATIPRQSEIKFFAWLVRSETVCEHEDGQPDPVGRCKSTTDNSYRRLTLTLNNVIPVNEGKYFCKLRSNLGVKFATTDVTVQGELTYILIILSNLVFYCCLLLSF